MQKIIENVIDSKNYELSDMLKKIDTLWLQGSITDEVRTRLSDKARVNANIQNSLNLILKIEELDRRVKALEETKQSTDLEEPTEESYPEYMAGVWYYAGNRVSFEGRNYECTAPEETPCVWSPTEYPTYWVEV